MKPRTDTRYFFRHTTRKPSLQGIHEAGFEIIPQAIKLDPRLLPFAQSTIDKKSHSIFNHNETNHRNDQRRRQQNLPLHSQYMQEFNNQVQAVIKSLIHTELTPTDPVILHSLPGCQPQAAHCDYVPDEALKAAGDAQMPLAILIALMPGTRLLVWPNSSRLATAKTEDLKNVNPINCVEVNLTPGDMLIFRGDFVHAGAGYSTDNYRIHYYLDSPVVPRERNRTWLIDQDGNDALRQIIKPFTLQTAQPKTVRFSLTTSDTVIKRKRDQESFDDVDEKNIITEAHRQTKRR